MADDESVVRLPGEGRALGAGSNVITYKLAGAETRGVFSVLERVVPPHFQSPPQPHTNTREDWAAYVLDGTLVFQLEDREIVALAASLVYVPRGVSFRWWKAACRTRQVRHDLRSGGVRGVFQRGHGRYQGRTSGTTRLRANAAGDPAD